MPSDSPAAAATSPASAASGSASFLLEVGTEELPSGAVASAVTQLRDALVTRLSGARLPVADTPDAVQTFATPRRLTVLIQSLPARQPDAEQEVRGPGVKAAFGPDGSPTKAAMGFAAKQGVSVEALETQGEYVVARRVEQGQSARDVLAAAIPELLRTLNFPKFMRWGEGGYRFGRPLRWFVALLGDEVVPFEVEGAVSGRESRGHRFLSDGSPVVIPSPQGYVETLRAAFVEPEPPVRARQITEQASALAQEAGGTALLPEPLVDENVYLTEWVTAVLGKFDPAYLTLPRPVLETAMKKHQRFFPVVGPDGNLMPCFIAVRSGGDAHIDTVRAGYEKVLASRFNDARFFFEHDRASTLADKQNRMARIVFQEKLGTLADKTERLRRILETIHLFEWTKEADNARRAAQLAKVDLSTEIVMELPALQGVMGREFAHLDGEPAAVADALFEQYLPRFSGDSLPHFKIGTALSLADRVDTLVGYMRFVGAEPKGSSDPFGLKRAASAIVDILARDRTLPPVSALVSAAEKAYAAQGVEQAAKPGDLKALLETRLRGLLEERGIRYDIIDAILSAPWDNVSSVVARADALSQHIFSSSEMAVAQAATRVRNILRAAKEEISPAPPSPAKLTTMEERTLFAFLGTVRQTAEDALVAGDYLDALDTLAALSDPINRLFDNVMIMAEDPEVRAARLSLLAQADRIYLRLADFSKLILD